MSASALHETPCRKCGKGLECNRTCEKLYNFLYPNGFNPIVSFGITDTTDEVGYRILAA